MDAVVTSAIIEGSLEEGKKTEETKEKLPKNCKENRYYYRHREEILERKRQKRLEDPEYQAKQKAKEDAKKMKEEEKLKKLKEKRKQLNQVNQKEKD